MSCGFQVLQRTVWHRVARSFALCILDASSCEASAVKPIISWRASSTTPTQWSMIIVASKGRRNLQRSPDIATCRALMGGSWCRWLLAMELLVLGSLRTRSTACRPRSSASPSPLRFFGDARLCPVWSRWLTCCRPPGRASFRGTRPIVALRQDASTKKIVIG